MSTQVMFGNKGASANAQVPQAPQAVVRRVPTQPLAKNAGPDTPDSVRYAGMDNLNEVDFGRTFSTPYAPDKSMFVVFVLWLVLFGSGGHRFYLGNRWTGIAMAGLGTFNGFLWLTGGVTAYLSYKAGNGMLSGGLISAVVVMVIHFIWLFFDLFYILVRKFTSR